MNDRELLELAAKAAGIKKDDSPHKGGGIGNDGFDIIGNMVTDWHNDLTWNPLTDDGDALRLAVKLGITVATGSQTSRFALAVGDAGEVMEERRADQYAATRRAIVRAAAEIGKAMP